jgi:hypothetical protein
LTLVGLFLKIGDSRHLTFAQWKMELAKRFGVSRASGEIGGYSWNAKDDVRRLLNRRGAIIVGNHLASYSIATTECGFVRPIASRHIRVASMI